MSDLLHARFDDLIKNGSDGESIAADRPAEYADEALATRFTARHGRDLRFVNLWGRWMVWDGQRWVRDDTLKALDLSRAVAREASAEIIEHNGPLRLASMVASAKTVAAIERLARSDRGHASLTSDWDANPWLLNTPGGTVDLRTGDLRPHAHEDLITKVTAVAPSGECPQWDKFLARVLNEDKELVAFVRRMVGYALTGSTREHALFFLYGTGANGKSVFLNTIHRLLGGYSTVAAMDTFTASKVERHPTDLAMLHGARLVTAQETEDGQQWAESRIKALTGGDPITARYMRQDFFSFTPEFKLIIGGNHKPSLRNVGEAERRRFNLIPFTVTIPKGERDPDLAEKLKAEWPGILAWAVRGCREWQRDGLSPPAVVVAATESYLAEEDAVGRFIEERCDTTDKNAETEIKDLYGSWAEWCSATGESARSLKWFSQKLASKFERCKALQSRRAALRGVRLTASISSATAFAGVKGA